MVVVVHQRPWEGVRVVEAVQHEAESMEAEARAHWRIAMASPAWTEWAAAAAAAQTTRLGRPDAAVGVGAAQQRRRPPAPGEAWAGPCWRRAGQGVGADAVRAAGARAATSCWAAGARGRDPWQTASAPDQDRARGIISLELGSHLER